MYLKNVYGNLRNDSGQLNINENDHTGIYWLWKIHDISFNMSPVLKIPYP